MDIYNDSDLETVNIQKEYLMYIACVLDEESASALRGMMDIIHPLNDNWKFFCHHMTMEFFPNPEDTGAEAYSHFLNNKYGLIVTHYAVDEELGVAAVKVVSGLPSKNETKHVTVAVNFNVGGKPFFSNKLTDWKSVDEPLVLNGTVQRCD